MKDNNKFYGTRKIDSKEVYGDLEIDVHNEYFIREEGSCVWHNVIKETVSSAPFHTLEDLGYKKVEDDKIENDYRHIGYVKEATRIWLHSYTLNGHTTTEVTKSRYGIETAFTFDELLACANIINDEELEIIGNATDNPELLKGGK